MLGAQLLDRGQVLGRVGRAEVGDRAVEVPPAVAVGDEAQPVVRVPGRGEDRLAGARRQRPRRARVARRRHPQLGPVPGHVRVVPAGEGEPEPVRGHPRERVEVVARGDHHGRLRAVERQFDDGVLRFRAAVVDLAHAEERLAVRGQLEVGITERRGLVRLRRDRDRLAAQLQPVDAVVGEVGVDDELRPEHLPGAAAVLVHAGPHVGPGRRHLFRRAALGPPHQGVATALVGPSLGPPDGAVGGQRRAAQPDAAAGDDARLDRRAPGPVGSDLGHQTRSSPGGLAATLGRSGSPSPIVVAPSLRLTSDRSATTSRSACVATS